jgi:hypothetical protein
MCAGGAAERGKHEKELDAGDAWRAPTTEYLKRFQLSVQEIIDVECGDMSPHSRWCRH